MKVTSDVIQDGAITATKLSSTAVNNTNIATTAITAQVEDTNPADDDYILTYDTSTASLKKVIFSKVGGGNLPRYTIPSMTVTPDLAAYGAFVWSFTGNGTLNNPSVIPDPGTWYIDIAVNTTGGYTLTLGSSYRTVYGFDFGCEPNSRYRLWMVSASDGKLDTSIERIV